MTTVHKKTFANIGKRALLLASIITATAFQGACTPVSTAIGAGARAGIALAEDRSITEVLSDTALRVAINAQLLEASFQELFWAVTTTVFEGRVLLTGRVTTEDLRDEASQIIWKIEGVREVLNEIEIGDNKNVTDSARDRMIMVSLRTKILRDPQIAGINYKIGAYDRALYLIGVAQNQGELDRVITHAREVRYVRKLVSYVLLSGDPSRLR